MSKKGLLVVLGAALLVGGCGDPFARKPAASPALAHNVYFALKDASPAARAELVEACHRYLKDHPGVTFFAAGEIVESHARDVNVRDWHVGLHIVFKNKEYHDLYQNAEDHHTFIDENRQNWASVRVFDTLVR
jgi:hypothetical protein